jgi:branched-chain amino acid transport system substrate-binding protein
MSRLTWVRGVGLLAGLALAACGDSGESKDTLVVGLISPTHGALTGEGEDWNRVAQLAIDEINAKGGVNGHKLELHIKDDMTQVDLSVQALNELIDEGAVAVVGPGFSGAAKAAMDVARMRTTPIMSPASTSPTLDLAPTEMVDGLWDDGYLFRDVPNDKKQVTAMVKYLKSINTTQVVFVYENTTYGTGFLDEFTTQFGGTGIMATSDFPQNLDATTTKTAVDDMLAVAQAGDTVILVALENDALQIVKECNTRGAGVKWFFTDGEHTEVFRGGLKAAGIAGTDIVGGTAATNPTTGEAYGVLQDHYDTLGLTTGIVQYSSNTWDAFFLIAAALVQQDHDFPGEPFGGVHLRDAITSVSRDGQIFHAGQWRDLAASIREGANVDYDGASGPVDFDGNGETVSPYEIWKINATGDFERVVYYEATCLTDNVGCP